VDEFILCLRDFQALEHASGDREFVNA